MKLKRLRSCPQWPLHSCVHNGGGWVNSVAEFFSATEEEGPTHVHFYCLREKAVVLFGNFPEAVQAKIRACKTVSFEMTLEEANVIIAEGLSDRPWRVSRDELLKASCVPGVPGFDWELRYEREAAAVQNGTWPLEVALPLPKEYC